MIHMVSQLARAPVLEKVKAHDAVALVTATPMHPNATCDNLAGQLAQRSRRVWLSIEEPSGHFFGGPISACLPCSNGTAWCGIEHVFSHPIMNGGFLLFMPCWPP